MTMRDMFNVPNKPHPDEPDELTPDTHPIDDIERTHDGGEQEGAGGRLNRGDPAEDPEKDLDEPGRADRTPRP